MKNNDTNKNSYQYKEPPSLISDDLLKENYDKHVINAKETLTEAKQAMEAVIVKDPLKNLRKSMKTLYINPLEDLRKSIKTLYVNPLINLRKSMKALYINPLEDLRKSIKVLYVDPLEDLRKSMKALYINPLEDLRKSIKTLYIENPLNEFRKTILKYGQITDAYKSIFTNSIPANNFEEAYREVLSSFIAAKGTGERDTTEAAFQVAKEINFETKTFSPSRLSVEFYITLLISLIFFLYSLTLSEQSELRLSELIIETQTNIIERLNDITAETEIQGTYYVVERAVNLRTKPTTKKSEVLTVLYPNQKLRLVERKGKWIMVEYYNHILDIHKNGWCYKKYLKIIK
ncbi:SH3 domain-containing protein [Candidatus Parcubacteria bacterium]|nr:SH3 domain-containing protein [Candidatus Parcubacteria bacterium]